MHWLSVRNFLEFAKVGLQNTKSLPSSLERKMEVIVLLNLWKLLHSNFSHDSRTLSTAVMLALTHPDRSQFYTTALALWMCGIRYK